MGITGTEALVRVSLLIFYTDVIGLRADLAGYAVAICVLWDGITDPLMGRISDMIALRGQRRRPYMAIGAIALAIAVVILFFPVQISSNIGKFGYLVFAYILFNTAMTIIAVPHAAFAGDLTEDVQERTELFGWRLFFANLGLLLGTALPGVAVLVGTGGVPPDSVTAVVLGVIAVGAAGVTLYTTRGRDEAQTQQVDWSIGPLFRELFGVARDHRFAILLMAYFVATLGLTLNSSLALYYYKYRLLLEESQTRGIIALFMLVFCLCIPVWVVAAKRVAKKTLLVGNIFGLGLMTCIAYPLFPAGNPYWPYVAAVLGGVFVGAVVLLDVAVADVVDADASEGGPSRFGTYFGMWKLGAKISRALALALTGKVLYWIEFEPNAVQSPETSWALAVAFGPVVGVFLILAAVIAAFYTDPAGAVGSEA